MIILSNLEVRGAVRSLAFSPDGQMLASAHARGWKVHLWDVMERRRSGAVLQSNVAALAFSPDGSLLAMATTAGRLSLWEQHEAGSFKLDTEHAGELTSGILPRLVFAPDGKTLAMTAQLTLLVAGGYRYRTSVSLLELHRKGKPGRLLDTKTWPTALAFSPDSTVLAVGALNRNVYLYDPRTRQCLNELVHGIKVHYVAFAPDGKRLATASMQGLVKLFDTQTGKKITTLKGQCRPLHALCWSPDSKIVATAGGEGTVSFYSVATATRRSAFDWGIGRVGAVAFSPDGMRAAAGGEGQIVIWDIDDWE